MVKCFVDLGGKRRLGAIIRSNTHTLWVRIMLGAKSKLIVKRHKVKHHVGGYYEDAHTTPWK